MISKSLWDLTSDSSHAPLITTLQPSQTHPHLRTFAHPAPSANNDVHPYLTLQISA